MQGLYLNPDAWYERARDHGLAEHPRARTSTAASARSQLGTGEKLAYDRLILATGSRSFVPPIEGFGVRRHRRAALGRRRDRAARLRPAPRRPAAPRSPAAACSAWRPRTRCTSSGCRTTVLERSDRLLKRQLDARAAEILRATSKGSGSSS